MTEEKRLLSPRVCIAVCIVMLSACLTLQVSPEKGLLAAICLSPLVVGADNVGRIAGWFGVRIERAVIALVRVVTAKSFLELAALMFAYSMPLGVWAGFLTMQGWTGENVAKAALWVATGLVIGYCSAIHADRLGVEKPRRGLATTFWVAKVLLALSVAVVGAQILVAIYFLPE